MPLSLYMDVHVPMVVTQTLRRRGVDLLTSQEDGTSTAEDDVLLARATALGRLLVTQDQDFLRISAEWQLTGQSFTGILFAAQQGASLGLLAADLELIVSCGEPDELRDRVTYLPLR
ncbi:DUF5615 family PIN-like protein [Tautonia marina]|uniref:DUF5615 family PIN-like protein n=1 Tax=Tautonia marina TaxID=2653855 RepID=UPI0012609F73|nr:DUF5615 family PIN-like protein [Tautonia marina]